MGFENRDYATQDSAPGRSVSEWEVWKKILAINIAVFLLQVFITRPATEADLHIQTFSSDQIFQEMESLSQSGQAELTEQERADLEKLVEEERQSQIREYLSTADRISVVQSWFELDTAKVLRGQVWRLVTTGFCHDRFGLWHILMNMLFLYWFGHRLEAQYGSREFLGFYMVGLVCASLCFMGLDLFTGEGVPAIGASGAVWAILALYALLHPYDRIYVYFLFPVQIRFLVLVYFAFDLHPVLLALSGEGYNDGVAHAAHVGGALFGFMYWYRQWSVMPVVDRLQQFVSRYRSSSSNRSAPTSRGPARETRNKMQAEREMDRVLEKISQSGYESLSAAERELLDAHSKRIREQRNR